ncbi:MAG: ABC-2 family transporter protein [Pseudomonadota bacterium]|nr:ABC-2 family transporter protein [Pseudomonadota bacterium]
MKAFGAAWRIGFTHVFAYRAEVAIQLVSISIVAALNGSLWAVATRGKDTVAGIPAADLRAYVLVAWVAVSFVATRVNEDIGRRFRDGQIGADLLRPMSLQRFWYARDLGRALATLLVQSLPLLVVFLLVFDVPFPARASTWLLFLVSLVLGHATNYGLSFLVGVAALPMQNISGLTHLKGTLVSVFSGALIPLELFGPALRPFVYALPFRAMAHTPATIFLERGVSVGPLLLQQAAWAGGLAVLGVLAWRAAARTLTVQGG